ncbi:MAG: hypothetical protein U0Q16_02535 [Bryobacteraceae bacterium]
MPLRLDAESLRDSIMAAGKLDHTTAHRSNSRCYPGWTSGGFVQGAGEVAAQRVSDSRRTYPMSFLGVLDIRSSTPIAQGAFLGDAAAVADDVER